MSSSDSDINMCNDDDYDDISCNVFDNYNSSDNYDCDSDSNNCSLFHDYDDSDSNDY